MTAEEMIGFFEDTLMPKQGTPEYALYEKRIAIWQKQKKSEEEVIAYAFIDFVADKARKRLQDE